jgi:hypothetical protein
MEELCLSQMVPKCKVAYKRRAQFTVLPWFRNWAQARASVNWKERRAERHQRTAADPELA